jgi:hypothetical protein
MIIGIIVLGYQIGKDTSFRLKDEIANSLLEKILLLMIIPLTRGRIRL